VPTPHSHPADAVVRARRTARRLLSGTGSSTVTAYHLDPRAPALLVAQALTSDGRLLVAACPPGRSALAAVGVEKPVDVRLDVTLDASEPGIRITAATAHLLGRLSWLAEDVESLLSSARASTCHCEITGGDPFERLAAVASSPGGRLGRVRFERVVVHDVTGVSSHWLREILNPEGSPQDGRTPGAPVQESPFEVWSPLRLLSAHEAVRRVGEIDLRAVCDGVREGGVPGVVCARRPTIGVCPSLWGRILCVDVDPHGVTLMHVGGRETTTIHVAFERVPATDREITAILVDLAQRSAPARPSRI